MYLTGIELLDWIGLRRVTEGGVALHDSDYVHWGRKVPCYLPEVFGRLIEAELTDLLQVNREGLRRMVVTPRGCDCYQRLSSKRGLTVDPEQSSGDCSVHPLTGHSRLRPVRGFTEEAKTASISEDSGWRRLSGPPDRLPMTGRTQEAKKRDGGRSLMRKRLKSKAQRGLVTVRIVYASRARPHALNQELKVDVRRGTVIDLDHATGLVAVRTTTPLSEVRIVRIEPCT